MSALKLDYEKKFPEQLSLYVKNPNIIHIEKLLRVFDCLKIKFTYYDKWNSNSDYMYDRFLGR